MIILENLSKSYYSKIEVPVLCNLNISLPSGLITILGSSGCGKTTLLNLLGGLDIPSGGKIICDGEVIPFHDPRRLVLYRRNKVGMIFQFYNLLPTLSALENLEIILDLTLYEKKEKKEICYHYLEKVGMADKADRFPSQLSGGEQQRVAVARALVKKPALILADEPTGNLDEVNHEKIINLLRSLVSEKTTFIIATHNERVSNLADYVVTIKNGQVI